MDLLAVLQDFHFHYRHSQMNLLSIFRDPSICPAISHLVFHSIFRVHLVRLLVEVGAVAELVVGAGEEEEPQDARLPALFPDHDLFHDLYYDLDLHGPIFQLFQQLGLLLPTFSKRLASDLETHLLSK